MTLHVDPFVFWWTVLVTCALLGVPLNRYRRDIARLREADDAIAERDAEIDRLSTFIDQQADMHAASAAEWSDRCQQITAIALSLDCEERTS